MISNISFLVIKFAYFVDLQEQQDFFCLQHLNRATFVLWKFVARFRLQTQ